VKSGLTQEQQAASALAAWIAEREWAAWGAQIARDFSAGGAGTDWLEDVKAQVRAGKSRPLSEGPPQRLSFRSMDVVTVSTGESGPFSLGSMSELLPVYDIIPPHFPLTPISRCHTM